MGASLIRLDAVKARVGLSRSEIYRRIASGDFPKPLIISGTRIRAWSSDEVQAWINTQIATAERDGGPTAGGSNATI